MNAGLCQNEKWNVYVWNSAILNVRGNYNLMKSVFSKIHSGETLQEWGSTEGKQFSDWYFRLIDSATDRHNMSQAFFFYMCTGEV